MTADSPSSSSPKPEMLEKARIETGPLQIGDDWPGTFIRGDNAAGYAMALHAVLEFVKAKCDMQGGSWLYVAQCEGLLGDLGASRVQGGADPEGLQRVPSAEALRASEASVEKERREREEWRAATQRMTAMVQEQAAEVESLRKERDTWKHAAEDELSRRRALGADLEAARAEATKAALEKAAKIMCFHCMMGRGMPQHHTRGTPGWWHPPTESWGWTHCESGPIYGALADAAIRATSSPAPPTSPLGTCLIQGATAHAEGMECIDWKPEPTPPSEEPRPTAEATHRCKVCGANWRLNPSTKVQPEGSWSLVWPYQCGKCCDNVAMADQIEAIGEPLRCARCREEIRPEGKGWMDAEVDLPSTRACGSHRGQALGPPGGRAHRP